MKIPNLSDINMAVEKGLVTSRLHPENPDIAIFNYTEKCQIEGVWDETTRQCRGLVMNTKTGEVLARPFPKFFNHGELAKYGEEIPDEKPIITMKEDGSLGILYWIGHTPYIATRGSFESDQAKWATKWFMENCDADEWQRDTTYLFEIVYPQNRIVLKYDFSGLILIAAVDIASGRSWPRGYNSPKTGVRNARELDPEIGDDLEVLKKIELENEEGFVCHYPTPDLRVKIKLAEYVRLHKIVTGVSEISIWEHLKESKSLEEVLNNVPDEFYNWVKTVADRLAKEHEAIHTKVLDEMADIIKNGREGDKDRKWYAEQIKQITYPGLGFLVLDGRPFASEIWKMVRPKGQLPFNPEA